MASGFYLDTPSNVSDSASPSQRTSLSDDDSDFDNLPYPQPLLRSAFLTPDFKAADYLSTLKNRHQTLADLRLELRTRSQTLAKELLDLVNGEYQAFLGLGSDLRGGEEKVEAVRVGVLGFVKGVDGVKGSVVERKDNVGRLLEDKKQVAEQIQVGRQLVEVHLLIRELEDALAIQSETAEGSDEEDSEEEEEDDGGQDVVGVARLERLVRKYLGLMQMISQIGHDHPFLVKQEEKLIRIRGTLLLDLGTALKQARRIGEERGNSKLLRVISLFGEMDEAAGAIKLLKETAKDTARDTR